MNLAGVEKIARAVLYEGYMLYPYRPSSVKNRQRFNFGVLYPRSYAELQPGSDAFASQTQCLVQGSILPEIEIRLRFLQSVQRLVGRLAGLFRIGPARITYVSSRWIAWRWTGAVSTPDGRWKSANWRCGWCMAIP